jgi:proteic killer suppression protein
LINSFADAGTEDVFDGNATKAALRVCPRVLWNVARRKLDQINAAIRLETLRVPPGNRLEPLKGERVGQYSIRINDKYRISSVGRSRGPRRFKLWITTEVTR